MRLALFLICGSLLAQPVVVEPASPRQGDALRVIATAPADSVTLAERTGRFFQQADGKWMAMLAVPVLAKPGVHDFEVRDAKGQVTSSQKITIRNARFRRQNVVLGRALTSLKPAPGEMETVASFRNTVTGVRHWDEPFLKPVPGCMTSPFGVLRMHNGKPTGSFHGGLDQRGATGTPVKAVAGGSVKIARMYNIHGGTVGLDHGQGVTTIYLHLSDFAVKEDQTVKKGDVIGYVGSTGRSTAPHLHWAIYVNGHSVNPTQWVKVPPCAAPKKSKSQ